MSTQDYDVVDGIKKSRNVHVGPRTVEGSVVGINVHARLKFKINNSVIPKISYISKTTHILTQTNLIFNNVTSSYN